jgi:hypothetical protein
VDWSRYKARCDAGDVVSRWLLEQTAALLDDVGDGALAAPLRSALAGAVLEKPADHRGGPETDMIELDLDAAAARRIADRVAGLAADPTLRLPGGRGLGGLPEAWGECADWLDGSHPRSPHRSG